MLYLDWGAATIGTAGGVIGLACTENLVGPAMAGDLRLCWHPRRDFTGLGLTDWIFCLECELQRANRAFRCYCIC